MHPPEALTECVRSFVQEAVAMLAAHPQASQVAMRERVSLRRDENGELRWTTTKSPEFGSVLGWRKIWDRMQSLYVKVGAMQALYDCEAGSQITKRAFPQKIVGVGIEHITSSFTVDNILFPLIETAVTDEGRFSFDDSKFEARWSQMWNALNAKEVSYVLLAPLLGFRPTSFRLSSLTIW